MRASYLLFTLFVILTLTSIIAPLAYSQERPIRWNFTPDPLIIAPGKTRNCFVQIVNPYIGKSVSYNLTLIAPEGFSIVDGNKSGIVPPLSYREIVIPIKASETVSIGFYTLNVTLDYSINGSLYHDTRQPPVTIEVRRRINLDALIQEALNMIKEWKEEILKQLSPQLEVSAKPSMTEVRPGDYFDVVVDVKNVGTGPAKNVKITLELPAAFTLKTGSPTISIELIDAGKSETVTYSVKAVKGAEVGSYSLIITYEYMNIIETTTTGSTSFTMIIKPVEKPFWQENFTLILGVVAIIIIVALLVRMRK